jgi:putative membrane protein
MAMKFLGRGLLVSTAALLLTAPGFAQSDATTLDANGNGGVQTADRQFMSEAARDSLAKIRLAYLALENAQNEQVKSFARQMLSDYGDASRNLADIATAQFVQLPNEIDPKDQDSFEALSQLHGAAFDKAYMKAMLSEHEADVSRFKKEAAKGNNQAMIDWARQTLPTLESDLKEAQKVAPVVGVHATMTSEEQRATSARKPSNTGSQQP